MNSITTRKFAPILSQTIKFHQQSSKLPRVNFQVKTNGAANMYRINAPTAFKSKRTVYGPNVNQRVQLAFQTSFKASRIKEIVWMIASFQMKSMAS